MVYVTLQALAWDVATCDMDCCDKALQRYLMGVMSGRFERTI